jgi:signal transduction histidine kinase/DNA-binding NarL/FixJ family response regulator
LNAAAGGIRLSDNLVRRKHNLVPLSTVKYCGSIVSGWAELLYSGRPSGIVLSLSVWFGSILQALPPGKAGTLKLRTKLLSSLVFVIAGLTCATLLILRHNAEVQLERQAEDEARNVILTFQVMQQERQIALSHKVDLLATVAAMRNGDVTTIHDAGEDPWQSAEHDLLALTDQNGHIRALRTTAGEFQGPEAEAMLRRSRRPGDLAGWWYSGAQLYQIAIQSFYSDPPANKVLAGMAVAGRAVDVQELRDLAKITATEVALRYGNEIVLSTIPVFKQAELADQLGDQAAPEQVQIDGEHYWGTLKFLTLGAKPPVSLIVLKSDREAQAALARLKHLFLGLGLLAVLAGGAVVFAICDRFTRPLGSLLGGVGALEKGDYDYRLNARGNDEVAQLTRAFGRMRSTLRTNEAQRQKLEDHLRQSQKMEAIGRLAGGVAHDFNNLLTVIKGHSTLMLEQLHPDEPLYTSSRQIEQAADRAASLTRQLLAFCRMQVLQPKIVDLNALISEMAKMLTRLIRADILFSFRPDEALGKVKADPGQLEQVILNFTVNAVDAMPNGGTLTIETHNIRVDENVARNRPVVPLGSYVMLAVTDTGCGMDTPTRARIFEPFFTTKELGKGTGLGLATVYGVIKQSGGWIWVESEAGKGTRFEVYLPRAVAAEEALTIPAKPAVVPGRGETVLIAEDEDAIRDLASRFLKTAGYTVVSANGGSAALEVAKRWGKPIHLVLTDMIMSELRGSELAALLRRNYPAIRVVYMSGYQDYGAKEVDFEPGAAFLQKPFSREGLLDVIAEALKSSPLDGGEGLTDIENILTTPMKAKRKTSRRSKRTLAV